MADFQKVLETPDIPSSPSAARVNTGSTAGDIAQGAGFLLNLVQANKQAKIEAQNTQLKNQNSAEFNAGAIQAQKDLAVLGQLSGTKQSMKKRELQQSAMQNLSSSGLQGYLEVSKASGIRLAVAEEQDALQEQEQAQVRVFNEQVRHGEQIVAGITADSSPEFQNLVKKYAADGFSAEELATISRTVNGRKEIANAMTAQAQAQRAAFGFKQDQISFQANSKINEFLLDAKNSLEVPSVILSSSVKAKNGNEVILAQEELKRQLIKKRNDFTKFLGTLSDAEKGAVDINQAITRFDNLSNQVLTISEKIDPVKANADIIKLGMQDTFAGWLTEGTNQQKAVALSVLNNLPPDRDLVMMAVGQSVESLNNVPAFTSLTNKLTRLSSGEVDTDDNTAITLTAESNGDLADKADIAASYNTDGALAKPIHKPETFNPLLKVQEQIAEDAEAVKTFVDLVQEDGSDVWETMRQQHTSVLAKSVYPSLRSFGIESGTVRFTPSASGMNYEFVAKGEPRKDVTLMGSLSTDVRGRKALNKSVQLINRMAKTASKLSGVPLSEVLTVYAESMNLVFQTKPVEEPQSGQEEN